MRTSFSRTLLVGQKVLRRIALSVEPRGQVEQRESENQ